MIQGETVGDRYVLKDVLGRGGAAEVWKAMDTELDVMRAVKILTDKAATRSTMRRRLKAEARALARLNHPHVLRVLDIGIDHQRPYLVMELLTGGSVSDRVRKDGPFPPAEAIVIILEVLSALAVAHGHGIVHRDIKPQNILLDEHGHAVVADFGIALVDQGERKTRTGVAMGSFAFMPPEQRVDAKRVGPSADLYATACTLFWMVTGRTPVDLFTDEEDAPRWAAVPEELRPILRWATQAEPADRPQTAAELSTALGELAPGAFVKQKALDPSRFPAPMSTLHGITSAEPETASAPTGSTAPSAYTMTPNFLLASEDDSDAFGLTAADTHIFEDTGDDLAGVAVVASPAPSTAVPAERQNRRGLLLFLASIVVLLLVLCLAGWRIQDAWLSTSVEAPAAPSVALRDAADAVVLPDDSDVDRDTEPASTAGGSAEPDVPAVGAQPVVAAPDPIGAGSAEAHPDALSTVWTGSFDGHPMTLSIKGPPGELRGNVSVSLRGNAVDTPVLGAWDPERGTLTLQDDLSTPDAGRYSAQLREGRLHGTFQTRYRRDTMREPRVVSFTLRPVSP